ncbi:hypothetical protein HMI54_007780 [Coelomomyces lativittatus]|nr:hypothetical protein HMI54_007780 [Coelomomyces lativittatus]KAJ1515593.1 hypothetical protein HMI56_003305 [Coelomomyces lativittatus]KAJ1517706.1 hypothetical protein HMI55_006251 [Coelomomyces lativittatus]
MSSTPTTGKTPPSSPVCPVAQTTQSTDPSLPKCPVHSTSDTLNPSNFIPQDLPNTPYSTHESLSKQRTVSSIPGPHTEKWVYPSSQQFYNALLRKGKETPIDHIDIMVELHNQLNEEAWKEVLRWEKYHRDECPKVKLLKLQGRPDDLSPKARFAGWWYGSPRPFDRHDWIVDRCGTKVRYIIDYYSGPDEGDTPTFYLDVRPALDSPTAIFDRVRHRFSNWWNPTGPISSNSVPEH